MEKIGDEIIKKLKFARKLPRVKPIAVIRHLNQKLGLPPPPMLPPLEEPQSKKELTSEEKERLGLELVEVLGRSAKSEKEYMEITREAIALIEKGANVNARTIPDSSNAVSKNSFIGYAIGNASYFGYTEVLKRLIREGGDVHERDKYGRTPLMIASFGSTPQFGNETEILGILLSEGARIDDVDIYRNTALMFAARFMKKERVAFLLEKGADAFYETDQGKNALEIASQPPRLLARDNGETIAILEEHMKKQMRFLVIDPIGSIVQSVANQTKVTIGNYNYPADLSFDVCTDPISAISGDFKTKYPGTHYATLYVYEDGIEIEVQDAGNLVYVAKAGERDYDEKEICRNRVTKPREIFPGDAILIKNSLIALTHVNGEKFGENPDVEKLRSFIVEHWSCRAKKGPNANGLSPKNTNEKPSIDENLPSLDEDEQSGGDTSSSCISDATAQREYHAITIPPYTESSGAAVGEDSKESYVPINMKMHGKTQLTPDCYVRVGRQNRELVLVVTHTQSGAHEHKVVVRNTLEGMQLMGCEFVTDFGRVVEISKDEKVITQLNAKIAHLALYPPTACLAQRPELNVENKTVYNNLSNDNINHWEHDIDGGYVLRLIGGISSFDHDRMIMVRKEAHFHLLGKASSYGREFSLDLGEEKTLEMGNGLVLTVRAGKDRTEVIHNTLNI